jgi:hypothetical protein
LKSTDFEQLRINASEEIVKAVRKISAISITCKDLGIPFSSSLFINIRDAMFHYKKLCDKGIDDIKIAEEQMCSITEHILRGIKDVLIELINTVIDVIETVRTYNSYEESLSLEERKEVRELVHNLKRYLLSIRADGMYLAYFSSDIVNDEKLKEMMNKILRLNEICEKREIHLFSAANSLLEY